MNTGGMLFPRQRVAFAVLVLSITTGCDTRIGPRPTESTIRSVASRCASGQIGPGSQLTLIVAEMKPSAAVARPDSDGREFVFYRFDAGGIALDVYAIDGSLYAAQFVQGASAEVESWFFCDTELLAKHIALSSEASSSGFDTGQP